MAFSTMMGQGNEGFHYTLLVLLIIYIERAFFDQALVIMDTHLKGKFAPGVLVVVLLLLLLLPPIVCKAGRVKCKMWHPHNIIHKYLHPGDLILGGLVYHTFFTSMPDSFTKVPLGPLNQSFV